MALRKLSPMWHKQTRPGARCREAWVHSGSFQLGRHPIQTQSPESAAHASFTGMRIVNLEDVHSSPTVLARQFSPVSKRPTCDHEATLLGACLKLLPLRGPIVANLLEINVP